MSTGAFVSRANFSMRSSFDMSFWNTLFLRAQKNSSGSFSKVMTTKSLLCAFAYSELAKSRSLWPLWMPSKTPMQATTSLVNENGSPSNVDNAAVSTLSFIILASCFKLAFFGEHHACFTASFVGSFEDSAVEHPSCFKFCLTHTCHTSRNYSCSL